MHKIKKNTDLHFLGCGSAFNPAYGNTAAYFCVGDALILIDCGEQVFQKIHEKHLIDGCERIYVFITHLHADHVGSLGSLISYAYFVQGKKPVVVHPEEGLIELLDISGIDRAAYIWERQHAENICGIQLIEVSVKHADDMKCYGFLIDEPLCRSYYSGDSYEIDEEILDKFLAGEIDFIYQDTCEFESQHKSHFPLTLLAQQIPEQERRRVRCMHFSNDFFEKLHKLGFDDVTGLMEDWKKE